ncbi:hypothetical protein ACGFIU_15700 [Rhodococcus oryzae]|nr:hypothetical protein [Rhodococcus sp. MTM3W5.2]AQA22065.1 putative membrane protein [Rhodococcus sp. MTM3W5.2]
MGSSEADLAMLGTIAKFAGFGAGLLSGAGALLGLGLFLNSQS